MGTGFEAPTWPAITASEAGPILSRFPSAGSLVALHWHSPRPFSAATLAETRSGPFLLKRHHRSVRTPAALAEEHGFMAHLRSGGLAVPPVMTAIDGTSVVAQGEWSYELHGVGQGTDMYRDRQSWTPFLSHHHGFEAGRALAQLHRAAATFTAAARGPHPLVASFTILPSRDPIAAASAYVAARPALAAFLAGRPWLTELAELCAALGGGLAERLASQPPLWTHNDWHPSNLLWSDDGTVGTIFDFGLATRTCALHDLAIAIERTAIPWLTLAAGADAMTADAAAALALLAGYRTLIPLSPADVETLVRLLPLVHIEFALSEIDYFAGVLNDQDQAAFAWQAYLVDHARWFLAPAGQAFLRQLESGASL